MPPDNSSPSLAKSLMTPQNTALLLIDHQPQMAFGVQSIDRALLINNVVGLAKAARVFKVPTVLTTVAAATFSGQIFPDIQRVFPNIKPIDRTTMNAWEDKRVVEAIEKTGRKKIVMAALWTEVCLVQPALDARAAQFEVYAVEDASGGTSVAAHNMAMQRLIQEGVRPVTWLQIMLEWQRDWARTATYDSVVQVAVEHAGAYGLGLGYAKELFGEHASESAA